MELEMEQTAAEIRRLKACINDLLSVLTLPAIWSGHEPSRIASTLLDALLGILRLDFAYFRLSDSDGGTPIEMVRVAGRRNPSVQPQEVVTCPPFPSTYCASPRQRFEYSIGVDPNSELCGLSSL